MNIPLIRHIDKLTEEHKRNFKWCLVLSWVFLFPFGTFISLLFSKIVMGKVSLSVFFAWSAFFIVINVILNLSWYSTFLKLSNNEPDFASSFMCPATFASIGLISAVVYYPLRFIFILVAVLLNISKNSDAIVWLPLIISPLFGFYGAIEINKRLKKENRS